MQHNTWCHNLKPLAAWPAQLVFLNSKSLRCVAAPGAHGCCGSAVPPTANGAWPLRCRRCCCACVTRAVCAVLSSRGQMQLLHATTSACQQAAKHTRLVQVATYSKTHGRLNIPAAVFGATDGTVVVLQDQLQLSAVQWHNGRADAQHCTGVAELHPSC